MNFLDRVTSRKVQKGEDVDVYFMDDKEAFDLVKHRRLFEKLRSLGFQSNCRVT